MANIFFKFVGVACIAAVQLSAALACDKDIYTKSLNAEQGAAALVKAQDSYRQVNGLSARFVQSSFLAALETSEVSQGQVRYSRPGKMRWDYDYPRRETFLINGGDAWFYQPELNQVMIDNLANMTSGDLPLLFLSGVGDLQSQFKLKEACQGKSSTTLMMLPRKAGALGSVKLVFNNKSGLPEKFEIEDVSGNTNSITLSELNASAAPAAEIFKLEIPKGTDIQDRRGDNE
jgi:outer membrane lipoprotein carrier protein